MYRYPLRETWRASLGWRLEPSGYWNFHQHTSNPQAVIINAAWAGEAILYPSVAGKT